LYFIYVALKQSSVPCTCICTKLSKH